MSLFIPDIPLSDFEAQAAVRDRLSTFSAEGDLGVLAPLALRLAAITGKETLTFPRKTVVLVAADHGHPDGAAEQTAIQTAQIAAGRAAVVPLARQVGAQLTIANVGLRNPPEIAGLVMVSAAPGSKNMVEGAALGLPRVTDAVLIGMNLASIEVSRGLDILVVGGVSRGGRLPSLAALHILTGRPLAELTTEAEEISLLERAIAVNRPERLDPLDIMRTVGGLDIAALTGLILAGAAARVPVILDDLSAAVAALLAAHLSPAVRAYWLAGHRSGDVAHDVALRALGARPLLDLGIAQAPGCGGVLALHIVEAAARLINETGSN